MGMLNSLARLIQWVLVSGSAFVLSLNDWLACFFLSRSFSVLTGAQKLCLCLCLPVLCCTAVKQASKG